MYSLNKALWAVVDESIIVAVNDPSVASIQQNRPDIAHQTTGEDRLAPCNRYVIDRVCGILR